MKFGQYRPQDAADRSVASIIGCAAADFAGFPAGNIALIRRGSCSFAIKATNALNAGASAVVIYNNIAGPLNGTLSAGFTLNIGVTGVTQAVGLQLAALVPGGLVMRLKTDTFRGQASTRNIFAETTTGDPNNVVMVGAHLDSVNAGPGIQDNGSGSATILEVAEQMAKVKPTNKVRFALWGAEESGLVGSTYYIANLPVAERQKIALYLNFDMISSPNYVRFVYDGDNSKFPVGTGSAAGPPGSAAIEQLFHDYFASQGLPSSERRSAAAVTTARSSPTPPLTWSIFRREGSSQAPKGSRRPKRQRSSEGLPASPTTGATTRRATRLRM